MNFDARSLMKKTIYSKKILIDLQHPAHLHFFRNLIKRLENENYKLKITGRDKDILVQLCDRYDIKVDFFGVGQNSIFSLFPELLYRQWRLFRIMSEFKPDLIMAVAGTFVSLVGKLRRIPVYIFYDTEHATVSNLLSFPFASCIYVPKCFRNKIRWKHCRYNGYHELAYLHPKYFKPDETVLEQLNISKNETFTVIRFVAWRAGHDIGQKGFTDENKIRAVKEFSRYGRVLVSSEGPLPPEIDEYRLTKGIEKIHHLMAFASLIFGESATMVSEGAMLGVPGVYIDHAGRGYTDEQEKKYQIVLHLTPDQQEHAIAKGISILKNPEREKWRSIGKKIIEDKVDVSEMLYHLVREYCPQEESG
jgi:predicted glycosyltransferase